MSGPLRRAGRGIDGAGALVTWSVAEGRRGRRWREVRSLPGAGVVSSLLLETDPDGRFSHTEIATPAGLLTLHPEPDGTIHGNAITSAGVRHVVGLPWAPDGVVLLHGSSVTSVAWAPGGGERALVLRIGLDLACGVGEEDRADLGLMAGADGLPLLSDASSWPLEDP